MHPYRRLLVLAVLTTATVPFAGTAVLLSDARGDLEAQFQNALDRAKATYQSRPAAVKSAQKPDAKAIADAFKKVAALGREKRDVRLKIARLRPVVQELRNRVDVAAVQSQQIERLAQVEEGRFLDLLRSGKLAATMGSEGRMSLRYVFRHLLVLSFGADIERDFGETFTVRAHTQFLADVTRRREEADARLLSLRADAAEAAAELGQLEDKHARLIINYRVADQEYEAASSVVEVSGDQLTAIKAEVERVHADVLKIQSELARIDARIRARAERALIEKGLMDPQQGTSGQVRLGKLRFSWPVYGPITAGFHDAAYRRHFGVQHEAIDIAQAQGSPVGVAADGVVLLVRDGGARGYTYILVGHQDGYATLYGHISRVAVSPGEEVRQGQVLGLSGGTPGTPGAGLQTTGPHLHFEVIQQGVNIDPKTVLP